MSFSFSWSWKQPDPLLYKYSKSCIIRYSVILLVPSASHQACKIVILVIFLSATKCKPRRSAARTRTRALKRTQQLTSQLSKQSLVKGNAKSFVDSGGHSRNLMRCARHPPALLHCHIHAAAFVYTATFAQQNPWSRSYLLHSLAR